MGEKVKPQKFWLACSGKNTLNLFAEGKAQNILDNILKYVKFEKDKSNSEKIIYVTFSDHSPTAMRRMKAKEALKTLKKYL